MILFKLNCYTNSFPLNHISEKAKLPETGIHDIPQNGGNLEKAKSLF